ncbi:hypothetical protein IWX49DRAFT_625923 [Phyllosticta citricarpa]
MTDRPFFVHHLPLIVLTDVDSPAVRSVAAGYITVLGTVTALTAAYTQGHTINLGIYYLSVVAALFGIVYVHHENDARMRLPEFVVSICRLISNR